MSSCPEKARKGILRTDWKDMTPKKHEPVVVHMDIRKLKPESETNLLSVSKARLEKLIAEAVVDAYTEQEQEVGLLTMIQEHLVVPFSVNVRGIEAIRGESGHDPRWPNCGSLPTRQRPAENRNPRFGAADARASRRGLDCSLSPLAPRVLSERIPILRFPGDRSGTDKSRDG